jgi:hypothetical protein
LAPSGAISVARQRKPAELDSARVSRVAKERPVRVQGVVVTRCVRGHRLGHLHQWSRAEESRILAESCPEDRVQMRPGCEHVAWAETLAESLV